MASLNTEWPGLLILFAVCGLVAFVGILWIRPTQPTCTFVSNEPGPIDVQGNQWWWDVYKCTDGTRRRIAASPKG